MSNKQPYRIFKNYYLYKKFKPFYKYYSALHDDFYKRFSPFARPCTLGIHKADNRGVVDIANGFLYNRMPKVANTTLIGNIYQDMVEKDGMTLPEVASYIKSNHVKPSRLSKKEVLEVKSTFKFVFVRNPYTRTFSAYLEKLSENSKKQSKYKRKAPKLFRKFSENPSFTDFCRYLESGGLYDNKHWAPQISLLVLPPAEFDFIGKLENIEHDFGVVSTQIPMLKGKRLMTRLGAVTGASASLDKFYTPGCKDIVYQLFREDFTLFGYEKDF